MDHPRSSIAPKGEAMVNRALVDLGPRSAANGSDHFGAAPLPHDEVVGADGTGVPPPSGPLRASEALAHRGMPTGPTCRPSGWLRRQKLWRIGGMIVADRTGVPWSLGPAPSEALMRLA